MDRKASAIFFAGIFLAWCALVVSAHGAVSVVSGGAARSCFEAALYNAPDRSGEATCSDALEAGTLTSDDRAATLVNRGILRERLERYKDALSDYNASLEMRPTLAEAYVDRGAVLIKMARYADAIVDLSKGIELGSQSSHIAYYDRGQAREHTGDLSGACADYKQALELQPNFSDAKLRMDICAIHIKHNPTPLNRGSN